MEFKPRVGITDSVNTNGAIEAVFVRDGITSVADYNSRRVGVVVLGYLENALSLEP